jgi:hypothetical protein
MARAKARAFIFCSVVRPALNRREIFIEAVPSTSVKQDLVRLNRNDGGDCKSGIAR